MANCPLKTSAPASAWKAAALLVASLLFTSCRAVHFYTQAARGQMEIMRRARPIPEVMNECFGESQKVKDRLALVQELRKFASSQLQLPAESQYDHYTDLHRKFVVWVVHAAPEFSVEAKTWWYPILGKLKYRGYFSEADAQQEGRRLRALGMDVDVSGTEAYSTLGWLRDPVLNTFLNRSDADLAELIFHELTHQRLYLKGDTDFNEALATAVGEAGARLWLKSKGRLADLENYNRRHRLQRDITAAILRTRNDLDSLYTQHHDAPPDTVRALKAAVLNRLREEARRLRTGAGVQRPPRVPLLNNARLNSVAAYYALLPGFERMIRTDHGDIPAFLRRVEAMKPLTKQQRRALLEP